MLAASSHERHSDAQDTLHYPTGGTARRRQRVHHPQALALGQLPSTTPIRPALAALGRGGSGSLAARPGSVARSAEGEADMSRRPPGRHPWKQETTRMRLGLRPRGWTRAAFCTTCGPVWLPTWFVVRDWCLTWCPWCYDATARGVEIVERPLVTCQGCKFYLWHPRGEGEPGGCTIGHGAWRPKRPHECAWWRP